MKIGDHAIDRLRQWPGCNQLDDSRLRFLLRRQVKKAQERKDFVLTPGGTLFPVSFLGKDGYAVVKNEFIVTVLPGEYCPEANELRSI